MFASLLKLLLFLLYLILLSVVLRLCELVVWYEAGFVASHLVDPVSLSVRKLKNLLDMRAVNYEGLVEKKELSHLVGQSGDVLDGELMEVDEDDQLENDTTLFSSRIHFYEEVEDKKDSVWVIQVTPPGHRKLLSPKSWKTIRRKVSHFGIRTGTFDCNLDPYFCIQKQWFKSSILLAMPQGETYKDHVTMVQNYKPGPSTYILDWINSHLKSKIRIFTSHDVAQEWMETAKTRPNHFPIRVAYFSNFYQPPLFFSSLSVKFTGRIKFAYIKMSKSSQKINIKVPSILIATPEGDLRYGEHAGEYISYKKLVLYLKTLSPDVNDAFIWSLSLVNLLCVFDFFITQGGVLKRSFYLSWTIGKSNFSFLAFWLPFIGTLQLSILEPFWNYANKALRRLLISNLMSYIRSDLLMYSHNTTFLLVTFLTYCCFIGLVKKYRERSTTVEQESDTAWLRGILQHYYLFLCGPPRNLSRVRQPPNRAHMEEGLDMLIERLAVPGFWLRPVIPTDYITNLPTWKYCSVKAMEKTGSDVQELKVDYCRVGTNEKSSDDSDSLPNENVSDPQNDDDQTPATRSDGDSRPNRNGTDAQHDDNLAPSTRSDADSRPNRNGTDAQNDDDLAPSTRSDADSRPNRNGTDAQNDDDRGHSSRSDDALYTDRLDRQQNSHSHDGHESQSNGAVGKDNEWPNNNIRSSECAICLNAYYQDVVVCGLPCGHAYHHGCIVRWLTGGNNCCPTCRWPAYKTKGCKLLKYQE